MYQSDNNVCYDSSAQGYRGIKFPLQHNYYEAGSYGTSPSRNIGLSNQRVDFQSGVQNNSRKMTNMQAPTILENFTMKMDATFTTTSAAGNMSGQWNESTYNSTCNNNTANHHGNRGRTTYTEQQVIDLEEAFKSNPYPTVQNRMALSQKVGVPEGKVKIWFQNRRARAKKVKSAMILPWRQTMMTCQKSAEEQNHNNNNVSSPISSSSKSNVPLESLLPLPTTGDNVPPKKLPLSLSKDKQQFQDPFYSEPFSQPQKDSYHWYGSNYNAPKGQLYGQSVNADNKQYNFRFPTVWPMPSNTDNTISATNRQHSTLEFNTRQQQKFDSTFNINSFNKNIFSTQPSPFVQTTLELNCNRQQNKLTDSVNYIPNSTSATSVNGNSICKTVATLALSEDASGDFKRDNANKSSSTLNDSTEAANEVLTEDTTCEKYTLKNKIHESYRHANLMLSPPPIRRFVFPFNTLVGDESINTNMCSTGSHVHYNQFTGMQSRLSQMDKPNSLYPLYNQPIGVEGIQNNIPPPTGYGMSAPGAYNMCSTYGASNLQPYMGMTSLPFPSQGINPATNCFPQPQGFSEGLIHKNDPHMVSSYYPTGQDTIQGYTNYAHPLQLNMFDEQKQFTEKLEQTQSTMPFVGDNGGSDDVTSESNDRRNSVDSTESNSESQSTDNASNRPQTAVWTVNNLINTCTQPAVSTPALSDWEGEKANYSVPKEFSVRT